MGSGAAFLNEGSAGLSCGGECSRLTGDADLDGWSAEDDDSAVDGWIAHPGCHQSADEDSGRAHRDHVWRPDAGEHVSDTSSGEEFDEDGGFAGRKNRAAYVRDDSRHHGAYVHVGYSGCWGH